MVKQNPNNPLKFVIKRRSSELKQKDAGTSSLREALVTNNAVNTDASLSGLETPVPMYRPEVLAYPFKALIPGQTVLNPFSPLNAFIPPIKLEPMTVEIKQEVFDEYWPVLPTNQSEAELEQVPVLKKLSYFVTDPVVAK
jgi:hypothetical protein